MNAVGIDCGTYNLVCCTRNDEGNFVNKRQVNAFIELPLDDRAIFNMMKSQKVPLIEREEDNVAYALGEAAMNMAYTFPGIELKRPMTSGCVNPKEKNAFQILCVMIHNLIEGSVKQDGTKLYYSVPANAINEETDVKYHSKVLQSIFKAYKSTEGFGVDAHEMNEGLALIYAEMAHKNMTAIGCSFGSGMVNVCYAMFGNPAFTFSLVNSGDFIDRMAAKATGETPAYINKQKCKIDLTKSPTNMTEMAIQTQYRLMMEATIAGIKKGFIDAKKSVRIEDPVDIVVAGGVSLPNGFVEMFKDVVATAKLSIPIGEITKPTDPLYSVGRGLLIAAEKSLE